MPVSVFDLFKVGIGPSSSHTVGPMNAANRFVSTLLQQQILSQVRRITVELFGSLGATGRGHGTDRALQLGLMGERPETIDPATIPDHLHTIATTHRIRLTDDHSIAFDARSDLIFHHRKSLTYHPNGMIFHAYDNDRELLQKHYYSVGGGFVVEQNAAAAGPGNGPPPYPFHSARQLLDLCTEQGLAISDLMLINERTWRPEPHIRQGLLDLWQTMKNCVQRGCQTQGVLPGGLKLKRRAPDLYRRLTRHPEHTLRDPLNVLDWVNLYALAVGEENAAGGQVVTAPTNGAAGIIPAVLHYCDRFHPHCDDDKIIRFLLTAGAIGILYKENASLSGADVGCQGEIGVACSMAAGALAEFLGGTMQQVENAAEIGMEHNLGLTCDPVGGLVQIPCIERNAMGAVKAINAARIALRGDGKHVVSLDKVIRTMRETGADMKTKYKETSRGGLAVNVIEC